MLSVRNPMNTLRRTDPFFDFGQSLTDSLFDDALMPNTLSSFTPAVDLWDDGNTLHFKTDLPGIEKKDVQVNVHNDKLKIFAESKTSDEYDTWTSHVRERGVKKYRRTIRLPAEVDESKINATMDQGVLCIDLPKMAVGEGKHKMIEVK